MQSRFIARWNWKLSHSFTIATTMDCLTTWIAMMKRAIQTLAPKYNSDRMVEEYARKIY